MNTCQQFLRLRAFLNFIFPSGGLLELIVFKEENQMFRELLGPDALISPSYSIVTHRRVISMSFPLHPDPPPHTHTLILSL